MSTQANSNVKSICISAPNQPNGALLVGFFLCVKVHSDTFGAETANWEYRLSLEGQKFKK